MRFSDWDYGEFIHVFDAPPSRKPSGHYASFCHVNVENTFCAIQAKP